MGNSIKRDSSIDIVKGIGIILMVIGHSGCSKWLHDFIYAFHMPLFFICSGYFYKPISTGEGQLTFCKKRINGLYVPYVKWSILFLLLHNVFYKLNIYSDSYGYMGSTSSLYDFMDVVVRLKDILLSMEGHEDLLGGFWFLRVLLFASLGYSVIDLLLNKWKNRNLKNAIVFCALFGLTIFAWYTSMHVWVFDSLFLIMYGCLFFVVGYLYKSYSLTLCLNKSWVNLICLLLVFIGSVLIPTEMICVPVKWILPYMIVASAGSLLMFNAARFLSRYKFSSVLVYVGRHTMLILALHFLSFKIINLIKVYAYNLPIKMLSCFLVVEEHNLYYWVAYVAVGVCVPLIIGKIGKKIFRLH